MANETQVTIVGNLTDDVVLRYTQQGVPVANFTIASTPRTFNKQTNQWEDGEALFLRASIWRDYAENVAGSLTKGMRVIAQGNLNQRSYEKDGQQRTSYELDVQEIGPALRFATAEVTRTGGSVPQNMAPQQPAQQQWATPGVQQQPTVQQAQAAWATPGLPGMPDETPF